jgi:hypothetical protein
MGRQRTTVVFTSIHIAVPEVVKRHPRAWIFGVDLYWKVPCNHSASTLPAKRYSLTGLVIFDSRQADVNELFA